MKAAMRGLLKRRLFSRSEGTEREIDEELRFHLELLTQEYLLQELSAEEAKAAAVMRFGNVESIREQCVAISRQGHPFVMALRSFLILMFLTGVVLRILDLDADVHHLGKLLMVVPILGRLLLFVRGLTPSSFLSTPQTESPLRLSENLEPLSVAYDQGMTKPVKRLVSDK